MSTQVQDLERTFRTLFPQLTDGARAQLAREVVSVVNKSMEHGIDLATVTLLLKGGRRTPIGTTLQNLRVRAGFTQTDVIKQTPRHTRGAPWHVAKLTRIESGRVPISFGDLEFLLRLYGVKKPESIDELWRVAQASQTIRQQARRAS